MRISVITPSIRPDMLQIVRESLEEQDFTDFEWLPMLSKKGEKPDLCKQMNAALDLASGEIILFYQDAIHLEPQSLEAISKLHETKNCGITYPVGKTLDWRETRWDWREYWEHREGIDYNRFEIDLASIPRSLIGEVRFDEAYDSGFGWENVQFALELELRNKVKFEVSREVRGIALDHDKLMEHPYKKRPNADLWTIRKGMIEQMYGADKGDAGNNQGGIPLGSA